MMLLDGWKLDYWKPLKPSQWQVYEYPNSEFRLEIYLEEVTLIKPLPCFYTREVLAKQYNLPL